MEVLLHASQLGSDAVLDAQEVGLALLDPLELARDIQVQLVGVGDCAPLLNVALVPSACTANSADLLLYCSDT